VAVAELKLQGAKSREEIVKAGKQLAMVRISFEILSIAIVMLYLNDRTSVSGSAKIDLPFL